MQEKTVQEAQSAIEAALAGLRDLASQLPEALKPLLQLAPPKGARVQVSLRHLKKDRQVKRSAPLHSWRADSGTVSISYELGEIERFPRYPEETQANIAITQGAVPPVPQTEVRVGDLVRGLASLGVPVLPRGEDRASDLVRALAEAERDPQFGFVSLKWFRDSFLPHQGLQWAAAPEHRHKALVEAINKNWILTTKVANPKNPQFPVTAIRLNRLLPEVRKILDQDGGNSAFMPITIPGESLSETVLRERR